MQAMLLLKQLPLKPLQKLLVMLPLLQKPLQTRLLQIMRKKHNLLIGERTAEEIKINIGAAYRRPEVITMEVRGRNLVTGLPKTIVVTSDETLEALREPAMQIVDAVHNVLERTPPELAADIFDRGIVLTGGGSLLSGLER